MECTLHFGERLAKVRNRATLTQEEVARWEGKTKQAIANREAKEDPVMGLKAIAQLLDATKTDARYLFGQLDDIGLADVRISDAPAAMSEMLTEYKDMKRRENERTSENSIGARVENDDLLRRIVVRLLKLRSSFPRIEGYLDALEQNNDGKHANAS